MAFRPRQKLTVYAPQKIFLEVLETNPNTGIGERKLVDQCAELPKPETMDLKLMVEAGVPLNQVDSKLLNPVGTIGLSESKKEEQKVEDKKE